jgi:hypothetical protein
MGTESQLFDMVADRLDLLLRCLRLHHYQHEMPPDPTVYWLEERRAIVGGVSDHVWSNEEIAEPAQ